MLSASRATKCGQQNRTFYVGKPIIRRSDRNVWTPNTHNLSTQTLERWIGHGLNDLVGDTCLTGACVLEVPPKTIIVSGWHGETTRTRHIKKHNPNTCLTYPKTRRCVQPDKATHPFFFSIGHSSAGRLKMSSNDALCLARIACCSAAGAPMSTSALNNHSSSLRSVILDLLLATEQPP